jgi:hypothetical protein
VRGIRVGASQVAGLPGQVEGAEGGGHVLWELGAGGVNGLGGKGSFLTTDVGRGPGQVSLGAWASSARGSWRIPWPAASAVESLHDGNHKRSKRCNPRRDRANRHQVTGPDR